MNDSNEQILLAHEVVVLPCKCGGGTPIADFSKDMFYFEVRCKSCGKTVIAFDVMGAINYWNDEATEKRKKITEIFSRCRKRLKAKGGT